MAAALLLIAALTFTAGRLGRGAPSTDTGSAGTSADPGQRAPAGSGGAASRGGAAESPVPSNAMPIRIGDRIEEGNPGPGAGSIDTPYNQDAYTFTAARGQRVYFRMVSHSTGLGYIKWKLVDENGMEVFNTCLGCGETGVVQLRGGAYTLMVGNEADPATGTYRLRLFDVPPPSQFSIKVDDTIRDGVPGMGAGAIESPGAEDVYTLTATPRQAVYFRSLERGAGMDYIKWALTDEDGMEVFSACLGCSEPGVQVLTKGGTYKLTVGSHTVPATGTYRLRLSSVPPPDEFSINVGDKIRPGVPGAAAGSIETSGAEDVYSFTASPGQQVYFRLLNHDKGMDYNKWRLLDDNGMELFNACLGCSPPGVQRLTRGGKYTLIVGNRTEPSTGSYAIETGPPESTFGAGSRSGPDRAG